MLATRHDVRLGLHRLRLEGELAEIREPDLRFAVAEARELFDVAGVDLPDLARLVERTEGWAAGMRLAALSLAAHPDPGRLAAPHCPAALIAEILSLLVGQTPALPAGPPPPLEALSDSEVRVLRYLPTNLSARQIAGELGDRAVGHATAAETGFWQALAIFQRTGAAESASVAGELSALTSAPGTEPGETRAR